MHGLLVEQVTHKLDYIPENWLVTQFSSLHTELVYDTQTFAEFFYVDPFKNFLQIQQMSLDNTRFPTKNRNRELLLREYTRVRLIKKSNYMLVRPQKNPLLLLVTLPKHHMFLCTNLIFL